MIAEWAGNSGLSWMCPGLPVSKLPNMFAFPYWHLRLNLSQSELSLLPPLLYVLVAFQASPCFLESAQTPVAPTWQSSPSIPSPLPFPLVPALTWPVTAPSCEPPCLPPVSANVSYKLLPCYLSLGAALVMLLFKNLASGRVPVHHVPNSAWYLIRNISLL